MLALAHPGLLWTGLGLVAVPLLIHLLFRRRHRVVRWAAMDFLLAALRKQRRRMRIEDLILLLVRCAVVALLGLALARPAVHAAALAALAGGDRSVVLLVDTSGSMDARHTGRRALERARERATAFLDHLPETSAVSLLVTRDEATGGRPRALLDGGSPADAKKRLGALRAGSGPNALGAAFRLAGEKLAVMKGRRQILFVTDMQRRDWEEGGGGKREDVLRALRSLRGEGEAAPPPVTLVDVGADESDNVVIEEFSREEGRELFAGTSCNLITRVVNYGPSEADGTLVLWMARADEGSWERKLAEPIRLKRGFEIGAPTTLVQELFLPLPPGSVGPARFRVTFESAGNADRLEADSERRLALRVRPPVRFLPVRTASGALDILRDAGADGAIDLRPPVQPEELSTLDLSAFDAVLWADAETHGLDEQGAKNMEGFVRRGGGLLAFLGSYASPTAMNRFLFAEDGQGLLPFRLREGNAVRLANESPAFFDVSAPLAHPLFREMTATDRARAMFYSPEILEYRVVEEAPEDSVVARFTTPGRDPAVVVHRLDRGRIVAILTTPDERGFRLNGSLLPAILFFESAHYLVSTDLKDRNVTVGGTVRVDLPPGARQVTVEPPAEAGGRTEEPVEDARKPFLLGDTSVPGFYRVTVRSASPGAGLPPAPDEVHIAAVNVDAEEGDLRRVSPEELRRSFQGVDLRFAREEGEEVTEGSIDADAEISRALLGAVVGLLALETLLAWRFGRRRRPGS